MCLLPGLTQTHDFPAPGSQVYRTTGVNYQISHNFLKNEVEIETKHVTQGQAWKAPAPEAAASEVTSGEESVCGPLDFLYARSQLRSTVSSLSMIRLLLF